MKREITEVSMEVSLSGGGRNTFSEQVRRAFAGCTVALIVLSLALPAHGAEYSLITNEFIADAVVHTAGSSLPDNFPPSQRYRPVTLTPLIAAEKGLSKNDTLTLNLFDDKVYTARIDKVFVNVNGTVTVRGRIEGYSLGYILISTTGDCSIGSIRIPEKGEYYVIQSQPDVKQHYLFDVDVTQLKELNDGPTPIPPSTTPPGTAEMKVRTDALQGGPLDPVTIDVMIVYTPAARSWAGGLSGINNIIAQAMAYSQLVLDNSSTYLTVNLVYSAEVNYAESGNSYTDLDRLTFFGGFDPWNLDPTGYMDVVQSWRNLYRADLVSLFTLVNDVGGLGWLLSTTSGSPEYGFSLVRVQQATGTTYTCIHEMGHNMGCHHYKWQATQPGPGLFNYSAGWRWVVNFVNYCSVMTYAQDGGYNGTTLAYFSNPNVYDRGVATGDANDGDNARTVRETKNVISTYRVASQRPSQLIAWGRNDYGQCNVPPPDINFTAAAGGDYHSLGLKADSSIVAWGRNDYGQCNVPSPDINFTAIAGGGYHSLGLKADGSIVAWGENSVGQCNVPSPDINFTAIAAGAYHSLGLKQDGSIVAWGNNVNGQCDVPSPDTNFTAIAAGDYHSLGLKTDSSIVAWGYNNYGQCNVPEPNTAFVAIAAGGDHSLGLKTDGSIVAWGRNNYGQCNVPPPNTSFTAIAAGEYYSLGLKGDGSIAAWGLNDYGQCNVPPPNMNFTAVAAGYSHSLGLKACQFILVGDLNDDCKVDFRDLLIMVNQWLQPPGTPSADIAPPPNGDGIVNLSDYARMSANWLIDCDINPSNPACVPK